MRIASLIVSWVCWLIAALYWLFLTIVSFQPSLMSRGAPQKSTDRLFLYTGIVCILVGFLLWFGRKRIWFDSARPVGAGFLLYLFPLYFAVLCAVVGPYLDFMVMGTQGLLFRTGFVVTAVLLILAFPRLPRKHLAEEDVTPQPVARPGSDSSAPLPPST